MLERRTIIWLGAYLLYVLGSFAFVAKPGMPLEAVDPPRELASVDGAELISLYVMPDEDHALAGLAFEDHGELWLIDWSRRGEWLDGRVGLEALELGRVEARKEPNDARWLGEGVLGLTIGDAESGIEWLRWAPPAEPVRAQLPRDTAWVTSAGEAITTAQLDARLAERGLRAWPGLAGVSDGVAFTRVNASTDPSYADYISPDDLLIFDRESGELLSEYDTVPIRWAHAPTRLRGLVYTTDRSTRLDLVLCGAQGCEEARAYSPWLGPERGSIVELDVSPTLARLALCTSEGEVLLFAWEGERADGTACLGTQLLPGGCGRVVIADSQRVLVRQDEGWVVLEFEPRGGWL